MAGGNKDDAQLAKFVVVVFPVENLPLASTFGDGAFLRSDPGFDGFVHLLFLVHQLRQDLDGFLANGVGLFKDLHLVQGFNRPHNPMRQLDDLFVAQFHRLKTPPVQRMILRSRTSCFSITLKASSKVAPNSFISLPCCSRIFRTSSLIRSSILNSSSITSYITSVTYSGWSYWMSPALVRRFRTCLAM